ncbi:3-dehydroquinate synthase [Blochmannia endosymbiont of Colobopsis nipponica]|uniref:3-dehydroquinate synthase n=1 Tax=Blochmannia endosymbiont of Colobopsis nipponica TaxID=2681987 RepID=UPI00177D8038|nr:3-dehydroquinate synthase [Blochmannia endosymbiont of Colobopsis nipponica]QOI10903.1 3-dehydroquinate synthase [Blochmannia endosymbiont of Colobopsis nipponica]
MKKLFLKLEKCGYPIFIGDGLLKRIDNYGLLELNRIAVIITNDVIAPLYLDLVSSRLSQNGFMFDKVILPNGESQKSLSVVEQVISLLLKQNYTRDMVIIALGGGVIGDLAGFVASIYQRGVCFVQIPTTLLAQVDAAIGGKTAVNHVLGKNMIGSYHQPSSVIIDLNCLSTLSRREFCSGLAEVIKYAVTFDCDFFIWLENHLNDLLSLNLQCLSYCVYRCCSLKIKVVEKDEREFNLRMLLNLGHTYAHAIESYFCYKGNWLHGEAVSVGIMMAMSFSFFLGWFSKSDFDRVRKLLIRASLPIYGPSKMLLEDYLPYIMRDKKNKLHGSCLVLPVQIGKAVVYDDISDDLLKQSIRNCLL